MNIVNIIEGIERLVVSLLFWIIFIPKSIFKIVSNPKWVPGYVTGELDKESDRFKDFMSPIILYLLNSVFLVFVYIFIKRDVLKDINVISKSDVTSFWDKIVAGLDISGDMITTLSGSYGFVAASLFLSFPLFFGLIIELFKRADLSRENLRRTTYIQCYYFSPLSFTFFLIIFSSSLLEEMEQNIMVITFLIFSIWFTITQIKFISNELGKKVYWSSLIYFVILSGVILGTFTFKSIFEAYEEDRIKVNGNTYKLPGSDTSSSNYTLEIKCPDCDTSSKDSLVIDAVLTGSGVFPVNLEIKVPNRTENIHTIVALKKYDKLKLEIPENQINNLFIDILDSNNNSIIGGINSGKAKMIRKVIGYLVVLILFGSVVIGLTSLLRKNNLK